MIEKLGLPIFWQSILFVLQGAVIAQLIPIVSYIIVAKLVDAEEFGVFSVWLGVARLYCVLATLRLENALVSEADGLARDKSVLLVILTVVLMSLLFIMTTTVMFFNAPESLSGLPLLAWILLVPCAFFFACDASLQSWAAADGRYRDLNKIRLAQAGIMATLQIAFVYFFRDSRSLIVGSCLGSFLAILVSNLIWPVRGLSGANILFELKKFWAKYKRFPIYSLPADGVSSFVAQLPVLIIGSRFGLDLAGQLALALKMILAPVGLLGRAVQDVFKRHAAIDFAKFGNCVALYKKMFMVLLPGGLLFVAVAVSIGEEVFVLIFGEEWRQAGKYVVWLSPAFALGFIVSPLSYIVYIVNRQYVDLVWQVVLLLTVLFAFLVPENAMQVILAYSLGYSVMYMVYIVITYRLSLGNSAVGTSA
jgi:O-antigen/teichoic acid export membrane protein